MNIRHYDDPDTGRPHFAKHGVLEQEVAEVLMRPSEDRPGREGSRVAIGRTRSGRYFVLSTCRIGKQTTSLSLLPILWWVNH